MPYKMNYYLVGISGSGMSALAQVLVHEGHSVSGSDRNIDFELSKRFRRLGVKIFKQDGSGISSKLDRAIISRAIENDNPDLIEARRLRIPVSYRQEVLKELFRTQTGIAVAGTSGKTTVVGMIGSIFDSVGQDLTIINGGIIKNYNNNVRIGRVPYYCIETDESEGDLKGFHSEIGVLTNIGRDHMPHKKLLKVYKDFAGEVKDTLVVNADSNLMFMNFKVTHSVLKDCTKPVIPAKAGIQSKNVEYRSGSRVKHGMTDELAKVSCRRQPNLNISNVKTITYGIDSNSDIRAEDIKLFPTYSVFKIDRYKIKLSIPGLYNIYNALAALGVARAWDISISNAAKGLERFKGIQRRFEIIGEKNGVKVIDDYAHNPNKIKAALDTARLGAKRIIAIYQPHGYKPTRMFFSELAGVFADNLGRQDFLFMPEIYYAGGKVRKNISSRDLIKEVKKRKGKLKAKFFLKRSDIIDEVTSILQPCDTVLIMGARDNSLSELGRLLLNKILP